MQGGGLWAFFLGLLVGAGLGAIGIARWYFRKMKDPETARKVLESMYQASHGHWLQISPTDTRAVCPCCGWTQPRDEKEIATGPSDP